MPKIPLFFCALLIASPSMAVAAPAVVDATPAEASTSATLLLDMPDGAKAREFQLDEMSISISRTMDSRGDSRGDVTISLGSVRPMDTSLLQWARQSEAGQDASRRVVITVPASSAPNVSVEMRYELEGAKIVGFSASHSLAAGATQVMLQVAARRVTINGVVMN